MKFVALCYQSARYISVSSIMIRQAVENPNSKKPSTRKDANVVSSPYFSPIQTRNQRKHVKIKYEKADEGSAVTKQQSIPSAVNATKTSVSEKLMAFQSKTKLQIGEVISVKQKPTDEDNIQDIPHLLSDIKVDTKLSPTVKTESKDTDDTKNSKATVSVTKRKSTEKTVKKENPNSNADAGMTKDTEGSVEQKQLKWMPKNWEKTLENMRIMRLDRAAPVDTMGCDKCIDDNADEKTKRFHHLIALMLSSQTKDQTTYDAMNRLKATGLTPQTMIAINVSELEKLLCPVSFYKTKVKNIQKAAQILIDQYDSDIPPTAETLMKLPGVGPKMAHLCMKTAWNVLSGIGVDTHVHRISNRLKWVPKPTKEPEQTRIVLEKWVPYELWWEINALMVGFGQTVCTPINPKCKECINYQCPSRAGKKEVI